MKCWQWLLIALVLSTTACTSTRVHIFSEGMEAAELSRIQESLTAGGFASELNSLPVPESIRGPTVLYSPLHGNLEQLETLGERLLALGYDISLEAVSKGNHFYTQSNVGLYLKPSRARNHDGKSLEGREFNGDCADLDAYLRFDTGQKFTAEFIGWDADAQRETVTELTGLWQRRGNSLVLISDGQRSELEVLPISNETQYGSVEGIRLLNRSEHLEGCDFVFRAVGNLQ